MSGFVWHVLVVSHVFSRIKGSATDVVGGLTEILGPTREVGESRRLHQREGRRSGASDSSPKATLVGNRRRVEEPIYLTPFLRPPSPSIFVVSCIRERERVGGREGRRRTDRCRRFVAAGWSMGSIQGMRSLAHRRADPGGFGRRSSTRGRRRPAPANGLRHMVVSGRRPLPLLLLLRHRVLPHHRDLTTRSLTRM